MIDSKAAVTYGDALFQLAVEQQQLLEIEGDVLYIQEVIKENPSFMDFLKSPLVSKDDKKKLLGALFAEGVQQIVRQFLYILVDHGREVVLEGALAQYVLSSREARGILEVKARVALPLKDETREALVKKLHDMTKREISLIEEIDTSLIGGMVLEIGDKRIDTSVARQLQELKKALLTTSHETLENGVNDSV